MKKIIKFAVDIIAIALIVILLLLAVDIWTINTEKGVTTHYGVATPTDGTINIGVREYKTGALGLVTGYEDAYLNGAWAKGMIILNKIDVDPYVGLHLT